MNGELQLLHLKEQIEGKVRNEMEKQQRDLFPKSTIKKPYKKNSVKIHKKKN